MSISKIPGPRLPEKNPEPTGANQASATEAVFTVKKERVKVTKKEVKKVTKGLAEIAFSMGYTNDLDSFSEEMAADIMAGLQLAAKRHRDKKTSQ